MTGEKLRILFVEDAPADVELEEHELRRGGLDFESLRVETRDHLLDALATFRPGLIISDFTLPSLDGLTALQIARERAPEVPFIFVSGTIGEERAIESLKSGATDYVVKDRMKGLASKVDRAVREARDRSERRRVEAQLRQSRKMEAVGRLAGGVAHDFNNLLTVINGYAQLMLSRLPPEGALRDHAEEVLKAGERAAALTRQLLVVSRRQLMKPGLLDLNDVVSRVEKMVRRLLGEDIDVVAKRGSSLWAVLADPGQIEQAILNLVLNARDAMPHGGKLVLETSNVILDPAAAGPLEGKPGPHVLLSVTDTGIGMDPETQSHLFEPFFTTKEAGKGTGLGLSSVYGIVRQSGGSIAVHSDLGRGASFRIYLPRAAGKAAPLSEGPRRPDPTKGSETILVVEHARAVRRLMVAVLSQSGYRVLFAEDGRQALRILGTHPGPLHLLIADVVLPGLSGPEIARDVLQSRPGVKVLYTSGFEERGSEEAALESGAVFLRRPFVPDSLLRRVRDVLDLDDPE